MVQQTVKRLRLTVKNIHCVTEESHHELLRRQVPDIPEENIVVEPDRKGTAGALALALGGWPGKRNPKTSSCSCRRII